MTVTPVSTGMQSQANSSPSASSTSVQGLAKNFDNFLLLLTKQLTAQDPLAPMDANQFTEQLVQFTGVEQAIATNDKLEKLIGAQTATQAATAISYLGTSITAESDVIQLADGEAEFQYELPADAHSVSVMIVDGRGKVVRAETADTKAGLHTFTWDGEDNAGNDLPEGLYAVQVTAIDANGEKMDNRVTVSGRVSGVEIREGGIVLSLGDLEIPFGDVLSVKAAEG